MIIPDINLLLYAYNDQAPHHARARDWWEGLLNGKTPVACRGSPSRDSSV